MFVYYRLQDFGLDGLLLGNIAQLRRNLFWQLCHSSRRLISLAAVWPNFNSVDREPWISETYPKSPRFGSH